VTTAVSELLAWVTGGSALAALAKVLLAVCGLVLGLIYRRYLGILGANRGKPAERQAYDALRGNLAEGNLAARVYAERLTRFLDLVDRFFGDAGMAARTLFPHAFGLRTPAPLWTAPAFDRCLLLAFIYPIGMIFIIWGVSGHVGPAEAALGLRPALAGWQRVVAALGVSVLVVSPLTPLLLPSGLVTKSFAILYVAIGFAVGLILSDVKPITLAVVFIVVVSAFFIVLTVAIVSGGGFVGVVVAFALALAAAVAVGVTAAAVKAIALLGALAVARVVGGAGTRPFSFTFVGLIYVVGVGSPIGAVFFLDDPRSEAELHAFTQAQIGMLATFGLFSLLLRFVWRGLPGKIWWAYVPAMIVVCLAFAQLLSPLNTWHVIGPLLLVLGLLTLINAPFDWASLGLTRALLRRGLELGEWWPYALALADALLAAVIIAALTLTMVLVVQAFDALAVHGGGAPVLPLDPLLTGIAARPIAPEYWWIYVLLLSTMIPSLVNLAIGGASLVRGLPGVPSLLLRFIPERGGVLRWDRHWIATVLTAQVAAGAALGIAAQVFLVWVIIGHVMPFFGLELLDMARDVASFNIPARVGHLFGVSV
jgi:hypothetical protein